MLRSVAISRIQQGLGFRSDLVAVIINALQEAQRELEGGQTLPWFLLKEDEVFSATVANGGAVPLPVDFLKFHKDEEPHFISTDNGKRYLTAKPYVEADMFYAFTDAGGPQAYTLRKDTVQFWPVPNATFDVIASYYARGVPLDGDVTNSWLLGCPDLLIARAGLAVAIDLENETATKKFAAMFTQWQGWLVKEMADREEHYMMRAMGRRH
jgi:hypothetical protein